MADDHRQFPMVAEPLTQQTLHHGYLRVVRHTLRHGLFAGGLSAELSREVLERGAAVAVLPYDPRRDRVVMIRQFRIGAHAAGDADPWLIEIVAGMVETGETTDDVARRETREETGLATGRLESICDCYVSPGGTSEYVSIYCAEVDTQDIPRLAGCQDEGEDIEVSVLSAAQAIALLDGGTLRNALTIIGLQWLALNHARLRQRWND